MFERERITKPSFFDGGKIGGPRATMWKVRAWPTTFVIDHNGIIRYRVHGDEQIDEAVDTLLDEMKDAGR